MHTDAQVKRSSYVDKRIRTQPTDLRFSACTCSHLRRTQIAVNTATCIVSRQPHAATHKDVSEVRFWNTPTGSVVI